MKNQNHTTPNLGQTPTEAHKRDSIHIAVEPMKAAHYLSPGTPVSVENGYAIENHSSPVGVVDPFLKTVVSRGELFWLMLFPETNENNKEKK